MNRALNSSLKSEHDESAPDAELVCAVRKGDKQAFVRIVARHQGMVCGIALGILGDFAASEDAAQDVFLKAWRAFHELREPDRLRSWLARMAHNASIDHLRRRRGDAAIEEALHVADQSPSPDEIAANEDEAALVQAFLAKLPETHRLPLVLFYREGQSVRAVAEALELSEDAVKQRLARGRETLRDRMSGLVERVLARTGPTTVFTMAIAAAIGALTAPTAVAGTAFASASASPGAVSGAGTASVWGALGASKTLLLAVLLAAAGIPVGYGISTSRRSAPDARTNLAAQAEAAPMRASLESSALFAEWRSLHEKYGTNAAAMPLLHQAIADLKDGFRRRAFHTALVAEWVRVDPAGGLKFFLTRERDPHQRHQFFDEWLALNAPAAVEALLTAGPGWDAPAREFLPEIARRVPSRVPELVARLPKAENAPETGGRMPLAENHADTSVRDAFAILAEGGLKAARDAAEAMTGPNREQALFGVALAWGKVDQDGAFAWARTLPEGTDRDEIMRVALVGKAAADPAAALERVDLIPSGGTGQPGDQFNTTGARVLSEAAKTDFETTLAWLAAHPGRLARGAVQALAPAVADRLNADAVGFLNEQVRNGSFTELLPAIEAALSKDAAGQREEVWDWLKIPPKNAPTNELKQMLLVMAGYNDPELALRLAGELPSTPAGDAQARDLTGTLLGPRGSYLHRFDELYRQAPEGLRLPLVERAFDYLSADTLDDPQRWIARLSLLPETRRARGIESIARAWTEQSPEEATGWVASLPPGDARNASVSVIASTWASQDAQGAAEWVATLPPGSERDRGATALVSAISEQYPREAWDWALSISETSERARAATAAAKAMAIRDPAGARQLLEAAPLAPELKAQVQLELEKAAQRQEGR